jgi:hypothetical protein
LPDDNRTVYERMKPHIAAIANGKHAGPLLPPVS